MTTDMSFFSSGFFSSFLHVSSIFFNILPYNFHCLFFSSYFSCLSPSLSVPHRSLFFCSSILIPWPSSPSLALSSISLILPHFSHSSSSLSFLFYFLILLLVFFFSSFYPHPSTIFPRCLFLLQFSISLALPHLYHSSSSLSLPF